ncbi:MAG TPA: VWA domain-containing protein [Firmicutes bacterium]|nr:VWA domain-containing protein [Bacillota bacterium]
MRDDTKSISHLGRIARLILSELRQDRGVRIGESTVLSRKVHTILPQDPSTVYVNAANDAGEVFYLRPRRNEILHMDVFHEPAQVDHRRIAEAIKRAVSSHLGDPLFQQARGLLLPLPGEILDFMDIQTGTGGGRVTGTLNYGKKPSLLRAHRNHVHVAAMLPDTCIALLPFIAEAIEEDVMRQGFEIRKVEHLVGVREPGAGAHDMEPYSSMFDSRLSAQGRSGLGADWESMSIDAKIQAISSLAEEFGGARNLLSLIEAIKNARDALPPEVAQEIGDTDDFISRLESLGMARRERFKTILTQRGEELSALLRANMVAVDAGVRRLLRKIPLVHGFQACHKGQGRGPKPGHHRFSKEACVPAKGEWIGALAVPETVVAGLVRRLRGVEPGHLFTRSDIRVRKYTPSRAPEICLLIDASASMVGKRMRAAKHLVQHLSLASSFRISVLTFQERTVSLKIASTRNPRAIADGLSSIKPAGLTPLASGICEALDFMKARKSRGVLLVLITDGIPTMNRWTADPAKDALTAARRIAQGKMPFVCIGLQPNREFLRRLVEVAGGRLYIVDEFDRDVLVALVRKACRITPDGAEYK